MKKSEFIKQVLEHQENTVFTSEGTVEAAVDLFVELGMSAPESSFAVFNGYSHDYLALWESEDDS